MSKIEAQRLTKVAESVIARDVYQPGYPNWNGIYKQRLPMKPGAQPGITHCNEAAETIIRELGYETKDMLSGIDGDRDNPDYGASWTGATAICENLEKAVKDFSTGVIQVSPRVAQEFANEGRPVLAAALVKPPETQSHVGVVVPGVYDVHLGPMIAQAGAKNGIFRAAQAFVGLYEPKYYIFPSKE